MNCSSSNITLESLQACLVSQATMIELLETRLEEQESQSQLFSTYGEFTAEITQFIGTILIFMMQAGFACLESAVVRSKNTRSTLFKNLLDMSVALSIWFLWGFAVSNNDWVSMFNFEINDPLNFMYSVSFACITSTIVSGGIAERMRFEVYALFSILMAGFIYPIIVSLCWASDGYFAKQGFLDFAGSGVVHMTGGFAGLAGTLALGPRFNRFDRDGKPERLAFAPRSPRMMVLGTFLLFLGWIPFNAISSSTLLSNDISIMYMCGVNTMLSGSVASLSFILIQRLRKGPNDLRVLLDCFLSGLVAITSCSGLVEPHHAIIIGFVATLLTLFGNSLLNRFRIDDPLGVSVVHGLNGIWGILAAGLFVQHRRASVLNSSLSTSRGLLDEDEPGTWSLFGIELLACLFIGFFSFSVSFIFFYSFRFTSFGLRVNKYIEALGLDMCYHDQFAFARISTAQINESNLKKEAETHIRLEKKIERKKRDLSQLEEENEEGTHKLTIQIGNQNVPVKDYDSDEDLDSFIPIADFPIPSRIQKEHELSLEDNSLGTPESPFLWQETTIKKDEHPTEYREVNLYEDGDHKLKAMEMTNTPSYSTTAMIKDMDGSEYESSDEESPSSLTYRMVSTHKTTPSMKQKEERKELEEEQMFHII